MCVSGHAYLKKDINSFASRLSAEARTWLDDAKGAPVAIVLEPQTAEVWECGEQERKSKVAIRRAQAAELRTRHTTVAFPPA